jgi:predicted cupin superfamily sugar epimerase
MKSAEYWIKNLDLQPHPEGGYFRETYRSVEIISKRALPERFSGDRVFSTCIYYLLDRDQYSAFHAIQQDEVWHFYEGSPLTLYILDPNGTYTSVKLGRDPEAREFLQAIVGAGSWFAAAVNDTESYSLVGCTVAPGFDFADFKLADRQQLLELFPDHRDLIEKFANV